MIKGNTENPKWNQEIVLSNLGLDDVVTFQLMTTNIETYENELVVDGEDTQSSEGVVIGETSIQVRNLVRRPEIQLTLTQPPKILERVCSALIDE